MDCGLRNVLLDRFEFVADEWGPLLENFVFLTLRDKDLALIANWEVARKEQKGQTKIFLVPLTLL